MTNSNKTLRSWLLVPMSGADHIERAAQSGADAIVLDLVELIAERDKPAARDKVREAIGTVRPSGAQVFVQVDPELIYADVHASVWPGLNGIVISRAESRAQVEEAAELLTQLEASRGLLPNTLKIVAACETAQGNQSAYDIVTASARVSAVTLGRADLIMDLRAEPSREIHLMQYLMQRLIIIAGAAGVTPVGAWWRAPDRGLLATPENTSEAVRRGRAIGFKGTMCLRPNQVDAINRAFA